MATASDRIRAARIAGEEELASRLEAQRREQIRRERIAAQERARQALEENAALQGLSLAAQSVPAISLRRGDVFIGGGERLLLVTNDPYVRMGEIVVRTSNLEDRAWGEWRFRPLRHVTRLVARKVVA